MMTTYAGEAVSVTPGTMPGEHAEKPYIRARYGARVNARSERYRNSRRRE